MIEFNQTAVVGAGAMGRGIAQMMLEAGSNVTLFDTQTVQLDAAQSAIAAGLAKRVEKKILTLEASAAMMAKLSLAAELGALKGSDLVAEAIASGSGGGVDYVASFRRG